MTDTTQVPMAIIGMACRFSGDVTNPSKLWELCVSGRDGHTPIPENRFDVRGVYHTDKGRVGGSSVKSRYFLGQDISLFDAAFFNLSSDAAAALDPQERFLLETVYEATEEGALNKDYYEIQSKDAEALPLSSPFGTGTAMLSNRISHFFDLRGPSISVDTGDSAGIVAVHQGCQSIRSGKSYMSIVAAANIFLGQDDLIGRVEGVAALILQPLDAALRDGNQVHAVIGDSGGYSLEDIGYVEARLTGTAAEDPYEAETIARAFDKNRDETDPVVFGSLNTNLGDTGPVSGIAALIKAVFLLKHRCQQLRRLGPKIGHYVSRDPSVGLDPDYHTEGHSNDTGCISNRSLEYLLSAKGSTACTTMMHQLAHHIVKSRPKPEDLAFTLAERRSRHCWVAAVRSRDIDELAAGLLSPTRKPSNTPPELPELGFVFNGPNAQWQAMGRELIEAYPIFGQRIYEADDILREYGALWSLKEELMRDKITTRVAEIQLSQPISVAIQLCLSLQRRDRGGIEILSFEEALGVAYFRGELCFQKQKLHSLRGGMIVAAVSSAVAEKYIASTNTSGGQVVVACINSPFHVTYSGDLDTLDEVANNLKNDDIVVGKLKAPMAYHSHHIRHVEKEYIEKLRPILGASTRKQTCFDTTVISPVTGGQVSPSVLLSPEHWACNMTSPVLFSQAFNNMIGNIDMLVEIGSHSILAAPIRQRLRDRNIERPYTSCLSRLVDAVDTMQDMVCELISRGYPVNFRQVKSPLGVEGQQQSHRLVTNLPSYPWNHTR
ncbi:beta-ketoacyl synthase domain-containing protein [Trichoderma harzianum]|uniref:Beta-ketoacyl synthase domain-containing protein n=1 Tax=Trichoderma harzianum TaxID=5544 RepID=A0A0G0AGU3_TRIHA|nr:beta-ketoacyl synthase domain-containing protein [Trichoderma harzianum]